MAETTPLGEPEPQVLDFEYDVEAEYINAAIDQTGVHPPERWRITINLHDDVDDLATRQRLRRAFEVYHAVEGYPVLPRPIDDPVTFVKAFEVWAADASGARERAADQMRADAFTREMKRWIGEHGSSRLKKAIVRGYRVTKLYAEERAALEFPGAWVDTAEDATLNERVDPSEEALDLEAKLAHHIAAVDGSLETRIMWMVEPPRELARMLDAAELDWGPDEVIAISPYLGRYLLIVPLDVDCRRPVERDQ